MKFRNLLFGFALALIANVSASGATFSVPVPNTPCTVSGVSSVAVGGIYSISGLLGSCPVTPPPPPSGCAETQGASFAGYTRSCDGFITWSQTQGVCSNCDIGSYNTVMGAYPVGTTPQGGSVNGQSFIIPLHNGKYIALKFVPTATGAVRFSTSSSYDASRGTISVSNSPGIFTKAAGALCSQSFGGSNSLQVGANVLASQCKVTADVMYYLNFVAANANGVNTCGKPEKICNVAYTVSKSN